MTGPLFKPESIHPLIGVEPELPSDDLNVLDDVAAAAKIVALGEPTHGQKEINQLRDRMTRYLIEHQGFRVVAMEDSAIKCRMVNDFIVYGKGTATGALSSQNFWTWKTREVLVMIEWLREWNLSHPDDLVRFIGIDIHDIATPANELSTVLSRIFADQSESYRSTLSDIATLTMWGDDEFDELTYTHYQTDLAEIAVLLQNSDGISSVDLDLGLDCVLSLQQSLRLWREIRIAPPAGSAARWNLRDNVMASRALAPTYDGNKVILWAHNGHAQSDKLAGIPEGAVTMGQLLREDLALEYCAISGVFGSGSYRAINQATGKMEPLDVGDPPVKSLDHELWRATDSPALMVSLNTPGSHLFEDQTTRWGDAALKDSAHMVTRIRPAIGSNAIAFVRETTPSEPI